MSVEELSVLIANIKYQYDKSLVHANYNLLLFVRLVGPVFWDFPVIIFFTHCNLIMTDIVACNNEKQREKRRKALLDAV